MNRKLMLLIERREHLIIQAAAQRTTLAQAIEPWRAPLARIDRGLAVLHYIKRHPVWIIGGSLLLAALRPGHRGSWLGRGWLAWKLLHQLRSKSSDNT